MEPYVIHFNPEEGNRFTVVGVIEDNRLKIGIAMCNPIDRFERKIGYRLAVARMRGRPYIDTPYRKGRKDWLERLRTQVKCCGSFRQKELKKELHKLYARNGRAS